MKKLVSLVLVLMLCLTSVAALADSVPSKTTEDLTIAEVTTANGNVEGLKFIVVQDTESEEYAICTAEVEKLAQADSIPAYFANAVTADGAPADLTALLGTTELNVYEMGALELSGYEAEYGDLTVTMKWPTDYEADEKVIVMIGIVGADNTVAWTALEGTNVADKGIVVTLTPELATAIQEGTVLVAIVSK